MHCQGLVFSDDPQRLMNSLIQTESRPPADVWTPLEIDDADGRSGWHTVPDGCRLQKHPYDYGQAVHCVWPTAFLRDHLGPHALLPDTALSSREVPRNHVQRRDGQWWAQVPRFFETVGVIWSPKRESQWQGHHSTDAAEGATVGSLDLLYNLETHDPNLIVGPTGPVFHQSPGTDGDDVVRRRLEAASLLMKLPSSTPVTLVNWHDVNLQPYGGQHWELTHTEPAGKQNCDCFRSDTDFDRPYRSYSGQEYW